jgi:hypothetical protein
MLKSKSNWTCSYCAKIFKDPIDLPCGDSVCREHLSEGDVVKTKKIKCKECNEEFRINDDEFRSNKTLRKLIEKQSYFSGEELSLKQKLEDSIRKFFVLLDEFNQNRTNLDMDVFNRFQEIRFQIDEQREELKKRIDDIALKMIDETKKHEEKYLQDLKEKLFETESFASLEKELNELEDTFRNPNLCIQEIKEMQSKQEESLKEIQLKLNEMNRVKDNLKATNEFQPNLSWFDHNETCLFGSIKLGEYCSYMNSFKSGILNGERQITELIKLCEFSPNDKWSLLYRGTRDGFASRDFHSLCDGHSNTLTIFKAKESKFIFGGFTSVSWESSTHLEWKSDAKAFIFSLTNIENKPLKMKIDSKRHQYAIRCRSEYGPTFGGGHDIHIANNANTTMDSYSFLGRTYKHPQYGLNTNEAFTFLAGSHNFQLDEIEVYKKE